MKATVLPVLLAALLAIAAPAAAAASQDTIGHGGGGGGSCSYYAVTFHIYLTNSGGLSTSAGKVSIYYPSVGAFLDGQSASLYSCTSYDIQPVILNSAFTFWYWYGANVNLGNPLSAATTLTPSGAGVLLLVLKQGPAGIAWAGYQASSSVTFASVAGTFQIPTTIGYVGQGLTTVYPCGIPSDTYDLEYIWVGIGGTNNNQYLWQAGISVWVRPSGAFFLLAFYETYGPVGPAGEPQYLCQVAVSAGDNVKVQLSYSSGTSSGSLTDLRTGQIWSLPSQSFTPDTTTAEWIAEPPQGWTAPSTSYLYFAGCSSSNSGNLLAPVEGMFTKDYSGHALSPQTLTSFTGFTVVYGP